MLQLENISLSYGQKSVLSDLNLTIPKGEIHGLVGLNGSGKTSLMNTIFGLQKVKGKLLWDNKALQKSDISFLETQNFFYSYMTAKEYLALFSHQNPEFDYKAWAELFELPLNTFAENLSTGMKKKLALIGVLSQNKPILLLDEPSNGMDLESNKILELILEKLKTQQKTVLITTHILEILMPICDKIHYLFGGKIQKSFEKNEFQDLEKTLADELKGRKQDQIDKLLT